MSVQKTTLTPGTYVFKLLDSQSDRHIVQIFNGDQTHLVTTILAIPNYRLQPTGHTVFAFWETPAGVPRALRAWFYPGDNFGQEFLDSKPAVLTASVTTQVPVTYSEKTEEVKQTTEIAKAEPPPEPAPAPEPEPAPEPAPQVQQPAPEPQPAPPVVAQTEQAPLPQTASNYPVIVLAGLLSSGLFALMTLFGRKRTE
jgi:LPXTG-motif cell wall-anchored protein